MPHPSSHRAVRPPLAVATLAGALLTALLALGACGDAPTAPAAPSVEAAAPNAAEQVARTRPCGPGRCR